MRYGYSSDLQWSKGTATEHAATLDLDLAIRDILTNHRLKERLHLLSADIRRSVLELIFEEIMPDILAQTGEPHHTPGYLGVNAQTNLQARSTVLVPTRPDTQLGIDTRMLIHLTMKTTSPVTALQALKGSYTAVATQVANHVINNLKHVVLGVYETESTDSMTHENGRVTGSEHRTDRSTAENN